MKGTYSKAKSWEKQSCWDLENGWLATVGDSHYGQTVQRLDSPDKKLYWHCSNGLGQLPEFAQNWVEELSNEHGPMFKLVRPRFEKVFNEGR